jgi:hypothetical protein
MPCQTFPLCGHGVAIVCTRGFARRRPLVRCVICHVPDTMASMQLCDGQASALARPAMPRCVSTMRGTWSPTPITARPMRRWLGLHKVDAPRWYAAYQRATRHTP